MDYKFYYTNTGNPIDFPPSELQQLVKSFFVDYLDASEDTDSGKMFSPIYISCSRVEKLQPLRNLLERMRQLSGADLEH